MAAEQRRLLQQLMGDSAETHSTEKLELTDPKVCRSYLVGHCPHDLFTNTKFDKGPCARVHDDDLKAEWNAKDDAEKKRLGYEFEYIRIIQKDVDDINRTIESAEKRLEKTPAEIRQTQDILRRIADHQANIECGITEVQVLGNMSLVSRAMDEFHVVQVHMQAKAELERELKSLSDTSGPSGHQKLQVCDVCGAFLSRLDNDRRLADHFFGKMHLGYAQMRRDLEAFPKEMRARAHRDNRGAGSFGGGRGGRGGRGFRGGRDG